MFNLTSEFILRQVRIVLFWGAGMLTARGIVSGETSSWIAGGALQIVTWAWSVYGNRLIARVNEIVKMDNFLVIAPSEVAVAAPSSNVMPMQAVTITAPSGIAAAVNASNSEANIKAAA
jgi:hypothetical protein